MGKKDSLLSTGSNLDMGSSSPALSASKKSIAENLDSNALFRSSNRSSISLEIQSFFAKKSDTDLESVSRKPSARWISSRASQVTLSVSEKKESIKHKLTRRSPKRSIESMPLELIYSVMKHLDIPSLLTLSRTCKFFFKLFKDDGLFKRLCMQKFHIHESKIPLLTHVAHGHSAPWKSCFIRLDSGLSTWAGLALDPITNDAKAYDMELIVQKMKTKLRYGLLPTTKRSGLSSAELERSFFRVSEFKGHCRWRQLDDAMTLVEGNITDALLPTPSRFQNDIFLPYGLPRLIEFSEVDILRGQDLAVPNKYQGLVAGNLVLGTYDPGHPNLIGCFAAAMEESLPVKPFDCVKDLKAESEYRGLLTHYRASLGIHETASYLRIQVRSILNGILEADITVYPSAHVRTSLQSIHADSEDQNDLEWESARLRLVAKLPQDNMMNSPSDSIAYPLDVIEIQRVYEGFSKRYHIWIDSHFPKTEQLQLFISGSSLLGLFLLPRPGCFCASLDSN